MRSLWIGFARLLIRGIFGILFHVRVEGELPKSGPLIVVANHQGWADGFFLAAALPLAARVRFLGDRDGTMSVWWHRLLLTSLGLVIPIDRTRRSADRAALGATMDALARGEVVIVFAEGRVSHAEATLGEFARGVGYLALRSGAPVLPMWLSGTAELYLGRELVVAVGRPRPVAKAIATKAASRALAARLHADLADLARPGVDAGSAPKRWRWLTDLF